MTNLLKTIQSAQSTQSAQPTTATSQTKKHPSKIIALAIATSLFCAPTYANKHQVSEQQNKQEESYSEVIGLGSGAVFGAIVGGPVGAFVGAFSGTLLGTTIHQEEELKENQANLATLRSDLRELDKVEAENATLTARMDWLSDENERLKQAQVNRLLAMTVQFRSGSSKIENHFANQLNELSQLLKSDPNLSVDLSGYADKRGESKANMVLSQQRANQVKAYLIAQGIDEARLTTYAFGDSKSISNKQDFEGNFFDRRVMLKAYKKTGGSQTAANF